MLQAGGVRFENFIIPDVTQAHGKISSLPLKSAKDSSGRNRLTDPEARAETGVAKIIAVDCQGDKRGEPKQHGQRIEGEDDKLVGESLKEAGGKGEVG